MKNEKQKEKKNNMKMATFQVIIIKIHTFYIQNYNAAYYALYCMPIVCLYTYDDDAYL